MGLDAHVHCRCIQDGKAKLHPFPKLLVFDPVNGANLRDGATDDQYLVHDKWFDSSCLHEGYAAVEWLGNMSSIAEIREILKRRKSGEDDFQVLLGKVVYSGTHCGDHLPIAGVLRLQQEIGKAKRDPITRWKLAHELPTVRALD